ncbi:MAG: hypothetical protein ABSH34_23820 [Verrucomicrobiota bacterium]|jgi:hypothetical protein
MSIERDEQIRFHELGTLTSVTRWIRSHDEGVAEWLKNARRAYQPDRANVAEQHRTAVLLFKDADGKWPSRIGLLDVGGATLDDVVRWSVWQDPDASSRGSGADEEITQGNGGKAYMVRLFSGPARILGVKDRRLNSKGFEGPPNTVDRYWPGFTPNVASGCDLPDAGWDAELQRALVPYDLTVAELPTEIQTAIRERAAFTLVEGVEPVEISEIYKGRIDAEDLVQKTLRHDQSTLAIQQLRLYAVQNGCLMNNGKPLELEPIRPYAGSESPIPYEIPEELQDDSGRMQSTTLGGARPKGRVVLYTSAANMHTAYKNLQPRWKVTYRAQNDVLGSKSVAELVPAVPGSYYIYATVELSALKPDYVDLGRRRPNDGPLIRAVDRFLAEKIRDLSRAISERRRHEQDQQALDQVHEENRKLDSFKNRFLPPGGFGGNGGTGDDGKGPGTIIIDPPPRQFGEVPEAIEISWPLTETLRVGKGVSLNITPIVRPHVRDAAGRIVPQVELEWHSADRHTVAFERGSHIQATGKGKTEIWAIIPGGSIESPRIAVEVWCVDHVLLTPRSLEIPLGKKQQILAEVTSDDGERSTNVFLNWTHEADDQLIVRIHPAGWVTGNRLGRTSITAGAGNPAEGGVWARIPAEVTVVPNPEELKRGGGFPQLLLTDRDVDQDGNGHESNADMPALWQERTDWMNNVWWLNLGAPDAAFFFAQRAENPTLWRAFHAQKVVEMVTQVHMSDEFSRLGENERKDFWGNHKLSLEAHQIRLSEPMWQVLQSYVMSGSGLE